MRFINLSTATWRKSSYSNPDGGACVEVCDDFADILAVRDSKDPQGPVLVFPAESWTAFVSAVEDGQFRM
ncbi:DUF397 domain-containing protein [Actinacidiphila acididurans]|uniref:DUF397 domain-containing protein n=1 Tax=Actinacidiphila acididurans TaxID=2784346 RepID=A0ABS2TY06_9ACTN|nr:DUF397 domain-containing protein [Actinacidiphila acididurans]MBM9507856.1 DUF397 domain-containing protein [Actinacidiphila acididurans]